MSTLQILLENREKRKSKTTRGLTVPQSLISFLVYFLLVVVVGGFPSFLLLFSFLSFSFFLSFFLSSFFY